jgi:hypothetical protein
MAKHWSEPLDPSRHRDHFHHGGASRRQIVAGARSYFVEVLGFTFEFASCAQIRACLAFMEQRIHESSRRPVFVHEKGEWQAWHERLPARILKASKRERVKAALRAALAAFAAEERRGP